MNKLAFKPSVIALLVTLVVSYFVCIAGDVLFGWTMYQSWMPLLPGFTWPLTAGGIVIGLVWILAYSVYVPTLFVLSYNYLVQRRVALTEKG